MTDWEARYQSQPCALGREPLGWLREHLALLPPRGRALDVAMGEGRNALFLASHGFEVVGVDRAPTAVERALSLAAEAGLALTAEVGDLEAGYAIAAGGFDVVVVSYYLQRDLFGALQAGLRPGGVLVYETHTVDHAKYRPMRDDFLLRPNELLHAFPALRVLRYRDVDDPDARRAYASLVALMAPADPARAVAGS